MPEHKWIHFKNIKKMLKMPFVIYADFESFTERIKDCDRNPSEPGTSKYQHHTPSGFYYKVVSTVSKYTKPAVVYRGSDVVQTFLEKMLEEELYIASIWKDA